MTLLMISRFGIAVPNLSPSRKKHNLLSNIDAKTLGNQEIVGFWFHQIESELH